MDEPTLDRALGLLPLALTPTTPEQLASLAQAVDETASELLALTDQMDGTSSRLALIASALTGTAAAARRMARHTKAQARAQMNTRERLQVAHRQLLSPELWDEAIREDAGAAGELRCSECNDLLPRDGVGWLCAPCELASSGSAAEIEGASVASAGAAGPPPLDQCEVTP